MNPFDIMRASQIACCLEVSAFKPGNVHRYKDFDDVKYHHFIASGIAFGEAVYELCINKSNIGYYIKKAVSLSRKWSPSNTNLGIILLHLPIALAISKVGTFDEKLLREELLRIAKNSTYKDTIYLYEAIKLANPNLTKPKEGPDVMDEESIKEIEEKKINLYDIFLFSADHDLIGGEWVNSFPISFEGCKLLEHYYEKERDINLAITKTFLSILSKYPDSLIIKKKGYDVAKKVSELAKKVLKDFSIEKLKEFDNYLRLEGNKLNPGTTADLTASSIMLFLIKRINESNTIL
ncbi:triphosphoribosyl-dephospho-CoA protein [Methanocaldococcus infernus ME]|uniref:Triphosphoribosyl-dephospho-CoA protein n=1 Tax=Methanocaldococcus infernus (strain DSM 11812 / JCM 15783 / ME) TaxID=573063 RepID=D5VRI6_METIM|nr:triphosphoribosyl-dephospho-CoA synthase [Methanocaldococcus infernus]ADG13189.1 triphosphoribosyl-dephospho-CoA protein [Methanocaldococcus infernus ME]